MLGEITLDQAWTAFNVDFIPLYQDSLRGPLFTAFLTIAGLIFAIHNFLVINLQKDVFAKPRYRLYARSSEPAKHPIDRLLAFSERCQQGAAVCFTVSILQFTVGFFNHWLAVSICCGSAIVACVVLMRLYRLQARVIAGWFAYLRKEYDAEDSQLIEEMDKAA